MNKLPKESYESAAETFLLVRSFKKKAANLVTLPINVQLSCGLCHLNRYVIGNGNKL